MAKATQPMLASKPEVFFENGCIVIRQFVVAGQQPNVTLFFNNKPLQRSAKYIPDIQQDGLAHVVTYKIKDVSFCKMRCHSFASSVQLCNSIANIAISLGCYLQNPS